MDDEPKSDSTQTEKVVINTNVPELSKQVVDSKWEKRDLKTPDGTIVIETDQSKNK